MVGLDDAGRMGGGVACGEAGRPFGRVRGERDQPRVVRTGRGGGREPASEARSVLGGMFHRRRREWDAGGGRSGGRGWRWRRRRGWRWGGESVETGGEGGEGGEGEGGEKEKEREDVWMERVEASMGRVMLAR